MLAAFLPLLNSETPQGGMVISVPLSSSTSPIADLLYWRETGQQPAVTHYKALEDSQLATRSPVCADIDEGWRLGSVVHQCDHLGVDRHPDGSGLGCDRHGGVNSGAHVSPH